MTDLSKNIQALREMKAVVEMGGGEKAIEKQIAMGKLTARDRILSLLDENSFHEYDLFVKHDGRDFGMDKKDLPGDGVVTGTGTIFGAPVCIYAQDFTVAGGSLGLQHARKITKIMDHALKMKCPIIGINDSGGARIQEGVGALAGYGEIFYRNTIASGVIPQISLILGPCAGGAVYSPALTDFVFVVENISKMFITGPNVIKTVLGEDISMEDLGGARVHAETTGNAHFYALSEHECFEQVKRLISFIPWNNQQRAKAFESKEPSTDLNIEKVVPVDPKQPYDVRDVIRCIADDSDFLEIQEMWAANIVIGFGRMGGETVGFVANQPMVLAGVLDCDSADKAARFIRFCDSFNIPIITLEDMPGYLPGVDQEHAGVIRHGAKVLYAYSEATVPKITVILRKAYGGGYINDGTFLGATMEFADVTKMWLTGLPDNDNYMAYNWVRAGNQYVKDNRDDFLKQTGEVQVSAEAYLDEDYYKYVVDLETSRDETYALDKNETFEKVLQASSASNGTWAPYALVSTLDYHPGFSLRHFVADKSRFVWDENGKEVGAGGGCNRFKEPYEKIYRAYYDPATNASLNYNDMSNVSSIRVVITKDRSKWTRCPVLEMSDNYTQSEGNVRRFQLRAAPSIDKDGNIDTAEYKHGMGWFPGYVINIETGERLNVMYGEDSRYPSENGKDMLWNPTSRTMLGSSDYVMGGRHF